METQTLKLKRQRIPRTLNEMRLSRPKLYEYYLHVKYKTGQTFKQFMAQL